MKIMNRALLDAIEEAAMNVAESVHAFPSNDQRADIWDEILDQIKPAGNDLQAVAKMYAQAWSRLWFLVQEFRDNPKSCTPELCQMALELTCINDDADDVRDVLEDYDTRTEAGWWNPDASNTEAVGRGPAAWTRTHEPLVGPDFAPKK